ncbi:MAG: hypothetical protein HZA63_09265 [Rhodocyclales bacterium]|nr:hypothetical protein [Rhodocyclales bacterium]
MSVISFSKSDQIWLASQMLFPAQSVLREDRQLAISKETPGRQKKMDEQTTAKERKLERSRQHELDRWAYSRDRKIVDFHLMLAQEQKRYEDAIAAGRYVVPLENQSPGEIGLFPYSALEDGITRLALPTESLVSIFERVPAAIHQRIADASLQGQLVGAVLVYLYYLKTLKLDNATLPTAIKVCLYRANAQYHRNPGRPKSESVSLLKGLRKDSLDDWWGRYRSVAHWWAAYVSIDNIALLPVDMPIGHDNLDEMIRRARFFARFGTNSFKGNPTRKTILWPGELIWPADVAAETTDDSIPWEVQRSSAAMRTYIQEALKMS